MLQAAPVEFVLNSVSINYIFKKLYLLIYFLDHILYLDKEIFNNGSDFTIKLHELALNNVIDNYWEVNLYSIN